MNTTRITGSISLALLVLYTEHLADTYAFYTDLGLAFDKEKHGTGPEHYAAELPDGTVIELYPATTKHPVTSARLGFHVPGSTMTPPLTIGRHLLQDPDGRTVEVYAT